MKPLQADELESILQKWKSGELSAREVHEEAEELMQTCDWHDVARTDPDSVLYEVLSQLDILNQQLIISDDIPAILRFLGSRGTDLTKAWQEWERYWSDVDFDERRRKLRGSDLYAV